MDDLADIAADLVEYVNFYISATERSKAPPEIAPAADSVCAYYQGVAISELLLDAEVDEFFHQMIRSGRSRRWLLQQAHRWGADRPKVCKASNTRGFFGALVAADWALASEISELSAQQWSPRFEYEDDFLYAHFLHRLVAGDATDVLKTIVADQARALDGEEPPRLSLCRGVLDRDEEATLAAFAGLIEDRRKDLAEMKETSLLATDELFVPFSAIYVEGLAWLRLIERAGMKTLSDYTYCPALARAESYAPFVPTTFPD